VVVERGVVAMFHEYEVWYIGLTDLGNGAQAYAYYKSKIGLGCKDGADVAMLIDGATLCYATPRGIVGMNYQQLTQNVDQVLSYLSDNISSYYQNWYKNGKVKIFQYKFWVAFYQEGNYNCLLFDIRNSSWWIWDSDITHKIKKIYLVDDKPFLLDDVGRTSILSSELENYVDIGTVEGFDANNQAALFVEGKHIDWHLLSEPLHFGAINNYKRLVSMSLNTIETSKMAFSYKVSARLFRNVVDTSPTEIVTFAIDQFRTYVKRFNYRQLVRFQYQIENDRDQANQIPLSLSAISTKYEVKGRIR
jgi:hypothetical protein